MDTPNNLATVSRAVVSAAAELAATVERAVVGDDRIRTARGNAYEAICADRARAQARDEMDALVRALLADGPRRAGRPEPLTQPAAAPRTVRGRRAASSRELLAAGSASGR